MEPRRVGCSVVEGRDITPAKVCALTDAADRCWGSILRRDLAAFAEAYRASFEAQVALFPGMVHPVFPDGTTTEAIAEAIGLWSSQPDVLAWKMPGAGGGGYLALVVEDGPRFCLRHPEAVALTIHRSGS